VRCRKASRPTAAIAGHEPRVVSEHAGEPLGGEANFDPSTCLAAYDGAAFVGSIVKRAGTFIAYDLHDRLIGSPPTLRATVRSIPAVRP
jgi:hypothetical protein